MVPCALASPVGHTLEEFQQEQLSPLLSCHDQTIECLNNGYVHNLLPSVLSHTLLRNDVHHVDGLFGQTIDSFLPDELDHLPSSSQNLWN